MNKNALRSIVLFLLIFVVLCAAYLPALINDYIHHDDVKFFLKTPSRTMIPDQYQGLFIGRPLGAMRLTASGFFIDRVSDFTVFRVISLILLSLSAWSMSLWSKNYYANKVCAVLATLIIFTLPAFQILVAFIGTCATPLALFLSIAAAVVAARIPPGSDLIRRFMSKPFVLTLFLLVSGLLIYPPVAMFYWVMVAVEILTFQGSWKRLADLFLVGFSALGIYFTMLLATKAYFAGLTLRGYDPYVMSFDIPGKLRWFVEEPLFNALNLWNIFPNRPWTYAVLLFILAAGAIRLFKLYGKLKNGTLDPRQLYGRCVLLVLFLLLFFLSSLPGLAATTNPGFYRCLAGLTGMVMLTILWSVDTWLGLFPQKTRDIVLPAFLAVILVTGIVLANKNLYAYRVKPSMVELRYLEDNLKKIDIDRLKSVHIIRPDFRGLKFRYDEFGTPATLYHHNILAVVTCALREINKEKLVIEDIKYDYDQQLYTYRFRSEMDPTQTFEYLIRISESLKNEPVPEADITIDINRLYEPGGPLDYLRL